MLVYTLILISKSHTDQSLKRETIPEEDVNMGELKKSWESWENKVTHNQSNYYIIPIKNLFMCE